jgi:HEAT repeat protein
MGLFKPNVQKLYAKKNVQGLIKALTDKDPEVRKGSAESLGKLKDVRAVNALVAALTDGEWKIRAEAAYALGEIGPQEAVLPLIAALEDGDRDVCINAAHALGKIRSKEAVVPLIATLNARGSFEGEFIANALGNIGAQEAVLPLIEFMTRLDEGSVEKKSVAYTALDKIGIPADPAIQARYRVAHCDWQGAIGFGSAAVEPLLEALEYPERVLNKRARRDAAHALSVLYNKKKIDEGARQKILAKRDAIRHSHEDHVQTYSELNCSGSMHTDLPAITLS